MALKKFLRRCGILLIILSVLGYLGFGPTADSSVLGSYLYFDPAETYLHLLLGVILLTAFALAKSDLLQRSMVVIIAILALMATVYGFLNAGAAPPNLGWTNFENPLENLIHFAVALWGLWVAFMPEGPLFVPDEPETQK